MIRLSINMLLGLVFPALLLTSCATTAPRDSLHPSRFNQTMAEASLLDDLRQGGYVIFIRHATAKKQGRKITPANLDECSGKRVLDGLGRTQSKVIGKSFRKLQIPVSEVAAGSHCQSMNMAKLAFGRATPSLTVSDKSESDTKTRKRTVKLLKKMLARPPRRGANTVIVAPDYLLSATSGTSLENGEAAIYKPRGDGTSKLVRRITPAGWQRLALER